ncbi:FliM/FliN family flagellar motor switch protein [[Clostridium] symbiosum]|uniref:FliM/FliN family flagellar motor switch protein n=1 Tax=Clostridium symbiosum TaxID=1512 RepID=UPI001D087F46|nr:FliM/FliN family flagellar motor switch protein [[Clostridium] symbiosum]MCB6609813.1 FliM/FliN family flagellar motor switch protein [[Clostridium] symbiosum]MCB6931231.1 FliM/FliN family flagellar motor switch protein [[Clostridium] symbiosum]
MPEIEKDAALEMMNAITLMMGDKLKQLLGRKSRIECREVRRIIPEGLELELPRSTVAVEEDRAAGQKQIRNLYIFEKETVSRVTNFIMGVDADAYNPLDEVALSTFKEVLSQCIRIEEAQLQTLLNVQQTGTVGELIMSESARDIEQRLRDWNNGILQFVRFGLEIEDVMKAEFYKITTDGLFASMEDETREDGQGVSGQDIQAVQERNRKKRPISVKTVSFPEFKMEEIENTVSDIGEERKKIRDISLNISVQIGRAVCKMKDILDMQEGQVLMLDKQAGAPADVVVNGVLIGRGDVLVSNDNFAARITEIIGKKE